MSKIQQLRDFIRKKKDQGYTYRGYPVYLPSVNELEKLKIITDSFGFPFEWMANLINFESAGTWNPAIKNSLGYVGLIQFGSAAATEIGTTQNALGNMSFSDQLLYVRKYLEESFENRNVLQSNGKVKSNFTQEDLFMTIFYPAAVGNKNYQFPANVVEANNGISNPTDYVNRIFETPDKAPFPPSLGLLSNSGTIIAGFGSFAKNPEKWWSIPTAILIFGGISLAITYYIKNRK